MTAHAHLIAGVLISVVSTLAYNAGFVIEKHALGKLPAVHARRVMHLLRSVFSSPLWLVGFVCMLTGLGLQVVALSLVSISVVQPILVSGIVVLLVLSHVSLKERLGRREWAALSVVAGAMLAISLSLDAKSDNPGAHGTFDSLVLAAIPTILVAVWLFLSADRLDRHLGRRVHLQAPIFGVSTGLIYGVSSLATKAVAAQVERHGVVASLPHVLGSAYVYALILSAGFGMLLFQTALQRSQASVLVPVSNVVSSAYVVAVGSVIFGEHLPGSEWKLALRVIGFVGVLASVLLLTKPPAAVEPEMALLEAPVVLNLATAESPGPPSHPSRP
jgi:drug/metabolite transporter (DMT)-like permease